MREKFDSLAGSDLAEFRQFFRRLRKLFPKQAAEVYLWYVATHGIDAAAESISFWLSADTVYVSVLLDMDSLPAEVALKAIAAVKAVDHEFPLKFAKAASDLTVPAAILRALGFLPSMGDYSIMISWLRRLGQNGDLRVRSRASKLLCELRPNKSLIDRHMQSEDARVRADAIETLWHSNAPDVREQFRAALGDTHHRVFGNALIGLHRLGETDALDKMIELCAHKDPLVRAAMAWCMGFVKDPRAIPTLRELTRDTSLAVRKRSLSSLLAIESVQKSEETSEAVIAVPDTATVADATPAKPAPIEPAISPLLADGPTFKPFQFR